MKKAFIKLHISVLIAGFTGIFGKVISLNEGLIIWYRGVCTIALFYILLKLFNKYVRLPFREALPIMLNGGVLAVHWFLFYGSIKASNVSVGVACIALISFFSAILEPPLLRQKFEWKSIFYSSIALVGVLLIFHLDTRYRLGVIMGVVSSFAASIFSIYNRSFVVRYRSETVLYYEILSSTILISAALPFYLHFTGNKFALISGIDIPYMAIFVVICTIVLWLLQIECLKTISAFTVSLAYNLEPVYSILIAFALLNEHHELEWSFFVGMGLVVLSVVLQSVDLIRKNKRKRYMPENIPTGETV